jgi:hypothetical protein
MRGEVRWQSLFQNHVKYTLFVLPEDERLKLIFCVKDNFYVNKTKNFNSSFTLRYFDEQISFIYMVFPEMYM